MRRFLLICLALWVATSAHAETPLRVFAAASLGEAVAAIAPLWEAKTGQKILPSYAGTATLARQIAAGAPADVFLSANGDWMDWMVDQGRVTPDSARVFASNTLVIVAPTGDRATPLPLMPDALISRLGGGRLAMGLPEAVPAGQYGHAALQTLGLWDGIKDQVAGTDSVRAALALVALGAAPLGVVYATDAAAEPRVTIVAILPPDSHPVIAYHAAPLSPGAAADFVTFLTQAQTQNSLRDLGFAPVKAEP